MDLTKDIEVSKELKLNIGYNHETKSVVFGIKYEGEHGYSKNESGVKIISILKEMAEKTKNPYDDTIVSLLDSLIEKLA